MRLRSDIHRLQLVFAVLALLLAQWLTFAHQLEHAGPLPERDCSQCVAALDLNLGLPGADMPPPLAWAAAHVQTVLLSLDAQTPLAPLHRARAPPQRL